MVSTKRIIPARISEDLANEVCEIAIKAYKSLNSSGVVRIDFLIDNKNNKVYANEINSIPGSLPYYLWDNRFNPNLYSNGKACLSLLGNWRGQSTKNWDPKISTLLQVLISIQSIIMSDLVYYNEPSCESEMGTSEWEAKNEAYSNIVRYANIKYAMIEQIKKPSQGIEEVIRRYFYLKKTKF